MKITSPLGVAVFLTVLATGLNAQNAPASSASPLPSDTEIRRMLAERVHSLSGSEDGIGIVIGIIEPKGRRLIAFGHSSQKDQRPLNGETVFEIGSVSKVFTALLVSDMARTGEVALTDPVSKYLPAGKTIPARAGHPITLVDLATHTSGLPFMTDELPALTHAPVTEHSNAEIYRFLAGYKLSRDPGAEWDYSNVGYWLLGEALSSRAHMSYEELLRTRISAPLKLRSTAAILTPPLKARMAVGHNAVLQPAPLFSSISIYNAMTAAGGLVSTVNDLLKFLAVAMGYESSPLGSSMAEMLNTRRPMGKSDQALGWVVLGKGDDQLYMHDGSTWGYSSYVVWDPKRRVGIVALSNQLASVGDIALHLLRPDTPLEPPVVARHIEIKIDSHNLDAFAGDYDVEDEGVVQVIREGNLLTLQLPISWGLPKFRLRPESRTAFFVAELPVRVTFQTDAKGQTNGLQLYSPRGQHALPAKKIVR